MNLSRLAVLAVFSMMVMSAFVTIPTYNVGADEHEDGGDDDGGPYLNAFPTGSSGHPSDYEMSVDNTNGDGANITVEATELIDGVSYTIEWAIWDESYNSTEGYWDFYGGSSSASVQYFIGPDILTASDFNPGCYKFEGWLYENDTYLIEHETWAFSLDVPLSDCEDNGHECPFDENDPDSPCNAQVCEDNDSQECKDFVDNYCANHDDPTCHAMNMEMVCYDIDNHEVYFDITTKEDCVDAGLMWVSPNGDDDDRIENLYVKVQMDSLSEWFVTVEGQYSVEDSDEMRDEAAYMCAEMSNNGDEFLGTNYSEITAACFEYVSEMMANEDNYENHDCPPGLTEDECTAFEECDQVMNQSCLRMMYNFCKDNPMCEDDEECYDDEGNLVECGSFFVFDMFAYEDGDITAEEFMAIMGDNMGDGDEGGHCYDENNDDWVDFRYGDNMDRCDFYENPMIYQTDLITVDVDQYVEIHSDFTPSFITSPNFICGDGITEISFHDVNNGTVDCEDGADEQWYDNNTNDTSDDCHKVNGSDCDGQPVNWFDCHDGSTIWIYQVNNWDWDCSDGEDEAQSYHHYWYGSIYLLEGNHSFVPGNDLSPDEIFAYEMTYCDWEDDNRTEVECSSHIGVDLAADNEYTLITAGGCYKNWEDDYSLECGNFGTYNHEVVYSDGTTSNIQGEVLDSTHGIQDAKNFTHGYGGYGDDSMSIDYDNFVLYDTYSLVVDEGTEYIGTLLTAGYRCQEEGDGEQWCHGEYPGVYLYDAFDATDTLSGLFGQSDYYDGEWECPEDIESCDIVSMDLELSEGDYTIVTTFKDDAKYNHKFIDNGDANWVFDESVKLHNAYYDRDESNNTFLVEGSDRTHFPYHFWTQECYDEATGEEIDCGTSGFGFMFSIFENMTLYQEGVLTVDESAENIVDLISMMIEMGMFNDDDDCHGEDCDDYYDDEDCVNCDDYNNDEHDDDPAMLDDIVGIQEPDQNECIMSSVNVVGNVADNEGLPMLCSSEFKIHFEGVDSTMQSHTAYIPFGDGESWTLEFVMLEGYEFISCDNCEVNADGIMTGTGPIKVTFGKKEVEEPQPDCDHVIGLDSTGMAFDPIKLSINAGETVCWQWKDAAMAHNVLELEGEYDSTMNLTNINFGFNSGEPAVTVDFRHTFAKDNMTHYYVCEPHAGTGMVGQIMVGEGSEDDPVQQALDDNEVPSVGFVVGSLVLVGAAGLRRRIH